MTAPRARCRMCGYSRRLTKHHLIPSDARGPRRGKALMVCRSCHDEIHERFTNEELAEKYRTPNLLRQAMGLPVNKIGRGFGAPRQKVPICNWQPQEEA